jgi:hypothetical protein
MRIFGLGLAPALGAVAAAFGAGCNADLTPSCVGGDGTCDEAIAPLADPQTSGPGGGQGGAGGAGGGPGCFVGDCHTVESGQTGDYPCDVEAVLAASCRRCHTAKAQPEISPPVLLDGTPLVYDDYEITQRLYTMSPPRAVFFFIKNDVDKMTMPLLPPPISAEQIKVLSDWGCNCAPPRAPGETCP